MAYQYEVGDIVKLKNSIRVEVTNGKFFEWEPIFV